MNIMTIESKNLYLQVDQIKEHLEMANSLYEILNQNIKEYDYEVLHQIIELKEIILQEKQEFSRGIMLSKRYIEQQNTKNMALVMKLCADTEKEMCEKAMTNPILNFF